MIRVVTISEKCVAYAREIHERLLAEGLPAELDISDDKGAAKLRRAQADGVDVALYIGPVEVQRGIIVSYKVGQPGSAISKTLDEFITEAKGEKE